MNEFSFRPEDILIFGREEDGMESHNMAKCDAMVAIKMSDKARSLNLAASVAIGGTFVLNFLTR